MKQTRSHIDELTTGSFQEVLDDPHVPIRRCAIRRVVFCSGKVAWDAMAPATSVALRSRSCGRAALPVADR
jgi:2-oxoglutarate dehydrogenase complex dehydrogenase (E1) component-like enzyme